MSIKTSKVNFPLEDLFDEFPYDYLVGYYVL